MTRRERFTRARATVGSSQIVTGLLAIVVAGCGSSSSTTDAPGSAATMATPATTATTAAGAVALRPLTLPELSPMAPSVQQQIRERHDALRRLTDNRATPPLELSHAFGEMGKLLMAAQTPDAAETSLLNAQTLDTSDFRWPYYLAQLARTQGQPDKSLALFERALQLQPDDVATLVWLGETNLQLGRPQAAEPQFARALSLQTNSVSARYGLGRAALAQNDFRRAVTHLEDVLQRDPKAAAVHYPLSLAYGGLGEKTKAAEHLRQRANYEILPADPLMVDLEGLLNSPQTFETQGIRALERHDYTSAADQFRKGLALAPDSAALHHRLGSALVMLGDASAARREFDEAVKMQPAHFLALFSLGVLAQDEGRLDEAIARFSAAIDARPTYTEARLRLASTLRRAGRPADAMGHYQQALTTQPDSTEGRLGLAMALTQLGRHREARDRLTEAVSGGGSDRAAFSHALARVLVTASDARVRDGQRAMALVQELVGQGRTLELGETMAMALAELGEFDRAVAVQRDLLTGATRGGVAAVMPRLSANLARYERREPSRTAWTKEEGP